LISIFFGLTPEYKLKSQQAIVDIAYFGGGGFDYETVYRMPIRNRNFVLNRIILLKEKENEAIKNPRSQSTNKAKPSEIPFAKKKLPKPF